MIVEIAETYRPIEKLSYPCGHLTVGFISEDPVSYTHLDVYKRQRNNNAKKDKGAQAPYFFDFEGEPWNLL